MMRHHSKTADGCVVCCFKEQNLCGTMFVVLNNRIFGLRLKTRIQKSVKKEYHVA
jgi:hypothetical protein